MTEGVSTSTMSMNDRSQAIGRAQRALKALGEHPRSSNEELGHAREHLNVCYSHGSSDHVWDAVTKVETMAERRYGVPSTEEQQQSSKPGADPEDPDGPATARRGRAAEDRALPPATRATSADVAMLSRCSED